MRVKLAYVRVVRAKGKRYTYYRRDGRETRIHGDLGSLDWLENYNRIHGLYDRPARLAASKGSFAALVAEFKASPSYRHLAQKTRADYDRHMNKIVDAMGRAQVTSLRRSNVFTIRDKIAMDHGDRTADYRIAVLGRLLAFAIDRDYRTDNPAQRIPKLSKPAGHEPWRDDEIDAFRKHWPLGSWERTAFELLIYTGQRSGDVRVMTWRQVGDGRVWARQSKTGEQIDIPQLSALAEALAAWPKAHVAILAGARGKPYGPDYFGRRMRSAVDAAELSGTIHGLRYTAATLLHEAGVDDETIGFFTGHRTADMVKQYSRKRRKTAAAIRKMEG